MLQGVRKEGILSTHDIKLRKTLQKHLFGAPVVPIFIPAPKWADDICNITNNAVDHQTCLYIVENFVNMERAKIINSKSEILNYNAPDIEKSSWEIFNSKIE